MWVRQCELDSAQEAPPPIPARIASNEEFIPPPQTPQQKEYEARVQAISEHAAKRQGISRRDYLRTGSGMAAALLALNDVFGPCYDVQADEAVDPQAFEEKWPKNQFVFDVQTHHVDIAQQWYDATPDGKVLWKYDMMKELKVVPFHLANCSPLIAGDLVMLLTSNGTDETGALARACVPEPHRCGPRDRLSLRRHLGLAAEHEPGFIDQSRSNTRCQPYGSYLVSGLVGLRGGNPCLHLGRGSVPWILQVRVVGRIIEPLEKELLAFRKRVV